jgi:Domain of unknown function (DUF1876)
VFPTRKETMAMEWTVRLHLHESAGAAVATATLVDEDEGSLSATGQFRTASTCQPISRVQFELAAARALQRLSDALLDAAGQTG